MRPLCIDSWYPRVFFNFKPKLVSDGCPLTLVGPSPFFNFNTKLVGDYQFWSKITSVQAPI